MYSNTGKNTSKRDDKKATLHKNLFSKGNFCILNLSGEKLPSESLPLDDLMRTPQGEKILWMNIQQALECQDLIKRVSYQPGLYFNLIITPENLTTISKKTDGGTTLYESQVSEPLMQLIGKCKENETCQGKLLLLLPDSDHSFIVYDLTDIDAHDQINGHLNRFSSTTYNYHTQSLKPLNPQLLQSELTPQKYLSYLNSMSQTQTRDKAFNTTIEQEPLHLQQKRTQLNSAMGLLLFMLLFILLYALIPAFMSVVAPAVTTVPATTWYYVMLFIFVAASILRFSQRKSTTLKDFAPFDALIALSLLAIACYTFAILPITLPLSIAIIAAMQIVLLYTMPSTYKKWWPLSSTKITALSAITMILILIQPVWIKVLTQLSIAQPFPWTIALLSAFTVILLICAFKVWKSWHEDLTTRNACDLKIDNRLPKKNAFGFKCPLIYLRVKFLEKSKNLNGDPSKRHLPPLLSNH